MSIKANIQIDQGADFATTILVAEESGDPVSLSGFTGNSHIRKSYSSSNSVAFTVEIEADSGLITLSLTNGQTSNLQSGRYLYDVMLRDSQNVVTRVVEGIITVTPRVTQ